MICGHSSPISTAPRCKRSEGVQLANAGSAQLCGISCSYRVSIVLLGYGAAHTVDQARVVGSGSPESQATWFRRAPPHPGAQPGEARPNPGSGTLDRRTLGTRRDPSVSLEDRFYLGANLCRGMDRPKVARLRCRPGSSILRHLSMNIHDLHCASLSGAFRCRARAKRKVVSAGDEVFEGWGAGRGWLVLQGLIISIWRRRWRRTWARRA